MFRRLRWFIGLNQRNWSTKRLPTPSHNQPLSDRVLPPPPPPVTLDTVHEVAVYIHRFHNLDLFHQGWYRIKITLRWEDGGNHAFMATPSRVVQYEVPEMGSEDPYGIWRIDDADNSFSTRPFRIKYARQDVYLSIMVAFSLPVCNHEGPSTSAVILKFELMYSPMLAHGSEFLDSQDMCSAAVHEYRIPSKALLGLHSYCPICFDSFHAVLVDVSVHISLLTSSTSLPPVTLPSDECADEVVSSEDVDGPNQSDSTTNMSFGQVAPVDSKQVAIIKALIAAHDLLLGDLQEISKSINTAIDLSDLTSKLDGIKLSLVDGVSVQHSSKPQNGIQKTDAMTGFQNDKSTHSMSGNDIVNSFNILGDQLSYLWKMFFTFHRANKRKILAFLRDTWAIDRRAEWSIWMVYSKVEMPHHFMSGRIDESSYLNSHGTALTLWKLSLDPAQGAAMRAELHRRSISQMRINNRSLQDMHIFGDPSCIPIVIVERAMNPPLPATGGNAYFSNLGRKDTNSILSKPISEAINKSTGGSSQQKDRILKVVVFVHGFQGHHLDLRLFRNQWLLIDPEIDSLMSQANENKTSGDFREMGLRLAEEVISFLKRRMDKVSRTANLRDIKLCFVGHSIGNIIIRTALAESIMEPYLRYLYTYISISGPHLGYLYSSNSLFSSGLWLLKKFKGAQCIHQLTFSDVPDLQGTFLYKLCKQKTFENFKNIILLSSPQNRIVPSFFF
ncbi:protein FAM135B-like isoform X3 [Carica papaya]|uniref:protein FAM135B-like isoform X3 n=1 Tax=Carica papaya TaxID=3649 RepID=UPI000B8C7FBD|nr:protein FAM135B-like isoform X3 [Carica papaya]